MADEEKHNVIMGLKQQYDEQGAKLRQVCSAIPCRHPPPPACRTVCPPLRSPHPPLPLQLEQQKRVAEATLRRAAITASQLDELPDGVSTYRSVGKA